MSSRGHIQNGTVVPDDEFPWPDGTAVVVTPVPRKSLEDLVGLLDTGGPPPTDAECERIRDEELSRRYGA